MCAHAENGTKVSLRAGSVLSLVVARRTVEMAKKAEAS
jgi:hypothetical protein